MGVRDKRGGRGHLDPTRPAFAAGVFLCVARRPEVGTAAWREDLVRSGLAGSFPGAFEIRTVQQMGWSGCGNGELLRRAADRGFRAIVQYQQNVANLPVPMVIMIARRTRLQELRPLVAEVTAVLSGDIERRIYRVVA